MRQQGERRGPGRPKKAINLDEILLKIMGQPQPKQVLFHQATTPYIGYGGAKGGGKSYAVDQKALMLCFNYPGIQILIVRRTLPELKENHINRLRRWCNQLPPEFQPKYNDEDKAFIFPRFAGAEKGSRIKCGYCAAESDVLQYQGQEYDIIFMDEATQFTEYQFHRLDECVGHGASKFPQRFYITCNPGGVGHAWVLRLFIDREYTAYEDPDNYTFIQATIFDNMKLFESDLGYVKALKEYMKEHGLKEPTKEAIEYAQWRAYYVSKLLSRPKDECRAYLYGDWHVFSGRYFGEFSELTHTCEPFPIPKHWRKSRAIDYGLDCFACLWIAVDEHGNAYVYRELARENLTVSMAAYEALAMTPPDEYIYQNIGPPDMWNRNRDTGRSSADIFAASEFPLVKAGNDRVDGWLNVKEWFKLQTNPDGTKAPRMLIFNNCHELIKCIQLLQYDTKKVNDVSTEPHEITHLPDALRYWCSRWQISADAQKTAEKADPFDFGYRQEDPRAAYGVGAVITQDYITGGY